MPTQHFMNLIPHSSQYLFAMDSANFQFSIPTSIDLLNLLSYNVISYFWRVTQMHNINHFDVVLIKSTTHQMGHVDLFAGEHTENVGLV